MTFLPKSDKWLLVQKNSGDHEVIGWNRILSKHQRCLKIGSVIPVMVKENDPLEIMTSAKILASSQNRTILEEKIKKLNALNPNPEKEEKEERDFSASESDWEPSDVASDSEEDGNKVKTWRHPRQRKSGKKILVPSNKANALIDQLEKKKIKILHSNSSNSNNPSTSQTYTNIPIENNQNIRTYSNRHANIQDIYRQSIKQMEMKEQIELKQTIQRINQEQIMLRQEQIIDDMRDTFKEVFKLIMKINGEEETLEDSRELDSQMPNIFGYYEQVGENSNFNQTTFQEEGSDESNRSEDNVLISNRYNSVNPPAAVEEVNMDDDNAWVPIGSGKTLIHKDQYRKIKWKSYTVATRTLLMAVFPRRVLATHSLTGKRSPAFTDKPAKMCLDPKIISDVVIEITDKFKVKENLVRNIITTKCADECKMFKLRMEKKKKQKCKPSLAEVSHTSNNGNGNVSVRAE